ncbi:hypothetical protein [Stenotrophomonas sp.]|uniref:hypothetical protein n=1 Tax=Stenotrophomonas sp. TaxID=69392 RepID=UPI002FC9155E
MVRSTLLLSLCLVAFAPGVALAKAKPAEPERAYIETSYVTAPRAVDDFALERNYYDPTNKLAGASFGYRSRVSPQATATVFVYPTGRMEPAEAVDAGMRSLHAELKQAEAAGIYTGLQELDETPFVLNPAAPGKGSNAVDTAVIAAIAQAGQLNGRRLRLAMHHVANDQPVHSSAYLFYKQLYYVKLRITADQASMSREAFDTLADRAARRLVPAAQVANIGGCAGGTIYVDPSAEPAQGAIQLARQMAIVQGYNCHGSASAARVDPDAPGNVVIRIDYDADDWKSQ